MSRKKKLVLVGLIVVFYLIIVVNFHKIRFALSILSLYNQEKIAIIDKKENINPIEYNPLQEILESMDSADKPLNPKDDENENDIVANSESEVVKKDNNLVHTKRSFTDIVNEYNSILEDLKFTFEKELDALIKNSIEEYSKGDISGSKLANKYLSIGGDLEKSSDTKFGKVLKNMEKELKDNGHSTDITKDIKEYYNSFKQNKKVELIDLGMKHID